MLPVAWLRSPHRTGRRRHSTSGQTTRFRSKPGTPTSWSPPSSPSSSSWESSSPSLTGSVVIPCQGPGFVCSIYVTMTRWRRDAGGDNSGLQKSRPLTFTVCMTPTVPCTARRSMYPWRRTHNTDPAVGRERPDPGTPSTSPEAVLAMWIRILGYLLYPVKLEGRTVLWLAIAQRVTGHGKSGKHQQEWFFLPIISWLKSWCRRSWSKTPVSLRHPM